MRFRFSLLPNCSLNNDLTVFYYNARIFKLFEVLHDITADDHDIGWRARDKLSKESIIA